MDTRTRMALLATALCTLQAGAQSQQDALRRDVVSGYAGWCHHLYGATEAAAKDMQRAIAAFVAKPDEKTLEAARSSWIAARRLFGMTEVFRFYDGPIDDANDGVESYLNAWPVDETYIDGVDGAFTTGIINDTKAFPNIGETVLLLANERGGEANVSLGWHAIEFLLWGRDSNPNGPGSRAPSDFVTGKAPNAERRAAYLTTVTALLVRQLGQLRAAWTPDAANYRRTFEADPADGLRRLLTGAIVFTGFELGGERLAVAYETRDQEQEHSCFSDTTHVDFECNQLGIAAVLTGVHDGKTYGPGVLALLARDHAPLAADLRRKLDATLAALRAIPRPFDQAMLGADEAPGRVAMRAALQTIEQQTDVLAIVGRALGYDLPLKPRS